MILKLLDKSVDKIVNSVMPTRIRDTWRNYKILSVRFGQYLSMKQGECVDRTGDPIPWYSFPAIEYIKQLDLSNKSVFEYGSGNSTLFWAKRCLRVCSIENDRAWYDKIKSLIPDNVDYKLIEQKSDYVNAVNGYQKKFDIIIIDGSYRYECAVKALPRLSDDGLIILDNSDWMEDTSEFLRNSDFIEVDMSGFGPINGYTWTTSFYFSRNVSLQPALGRQPFHGVGSLPHRKRDYV